MFGGIKHRLGDAYRSTVAAVSAVPTESKFVENGTLTPAEFLEAGDQLAFKFPTWQWEAGDKALGASYFPPEQQYLITRNVPCRDRVNALDYELEHNTRTEDDWVLHGVADSVEAGTDEIKDSVSKEPAKEESSGGFAGATDDFISTPADSGLADFSDLDAALKEEEPGMAEEAPTFGGGGYVVAEAPDAHIVKTRTYDLSITYDKYYQTPRLWLFGYDEDGKPLSDKAVHEDILSQYIEKTVTFDPHPLTGTPTVSIHPCKHAQVFKKKNAEMIEKGIEPRPDLALFQLLKFISSIVPTINYDFTMDTES